MRVTTLQCWKYTGMISSAPYTKVIDDASKMPGAKFFPGARLNFAENLLRFRDDHPAIVFKAETSNTETVITYKELYARVAQLSARLAELSVVPGDHVVAYTPNIPETIIAMLAATSLGAIWSSCSPDFGSQGVLDRFAQVMPLFALHCLVPMTNHLTLLSLLMLVDHAEGGVRD